MQNLANFDPIDALAWQAEMGVDLCVEETPQKAEVYAFPTGPAVAPESAPGQMARPHTQAERPAPGATTPQTATPPASIAAAIAEARALADAATDLASLNEAIKSFTGCPLKKTATNTVFAQGVPESRVMFIGEAPGAEEDRQGVPFCGPSGQLLDTMLGFIGLKRAENFYISNTLFWRPPGNRQPTPEELEMCKPFVEKHIALVNPRILTLVGGTATKAVLNESRGITRLRGQVFNYTNQYLNGASIPVHVIYHPSYLLRQPMAKKQCWGDLLALKEALTLAV